MVVVAVDHSVVFFDLELDFGRGLIDEVDLLRCFEIVLESMLLLFLHLLLLLSSHLMHFDVLLDRIPKHQFYLSFDLLQVFLEMVVEAGRHIDER